MDIAYYVNIVVSLTCTKVQNATEGAIKQIGNN